MKIQIKSSDKLEQFENSPTDRFQQEFPQVDSFNELVSDAKGAEIYKNKGNYKPQL